MPLIMPSTLAQLSGRALDNIVKQRRGLLSPGTSLPGQFLKR